MLYTMLLVEMVVEADRNWPIPLEVFETWNIAVFICSSGCISNFILESHHVHDS